MRENTIPPMRRLSRINENGKLAVDVSSNWMQEIYDYEERRNLLAKKYQSLLDNNNFEDNDLE